MPATGGSLGITPAFEGGYGRIILTASDSTQFAWEGDKVIGETENSLFTHFLIEGLEGEADLDGDGRITVDELYDYVYEKVKLATPKQTPSKFSTKQQGEIVLRQITHMEDIKPVSLPGDLLSEIEDPRTYVREAAVKNLEKFLKGKNLGLARSARQALEMIAKEDDSRTVASAAKKALESLGAGAPIISRETQARNLIDENKETEQLAKKEAERLALALPEDLIGEIEDNRPYVRERSVLILEKILKGRNIGMARSAREALERIEKEDDSQRVSQAATQALQSMRQSEQLVLQKAEEEHLAREKVETKKDDVQRLVEYTNAKVVLVGDTGVGKSGLALALTNQPFAPTESTHGRRVLRFEIKEVDSSNNRKVIQETILWDLAGQPGYRLIHQLDLQDIAVAIIVFDARSDTNPLSGVTHWIRALQQIDKSQGDDGPKLVRFLVAARTDRGQINMSREQIIQFKEKHGFQEYYETSALEGWNITQLSEAIRQAIDWDALPKVSSSLFFERVKNFLDKEKLAHRILSPIDDLYRTFISTQEEVEPSEDLRAQFNNCISRAESLGLLRSLRFGNFILLQTEILASYTSALINAVKSDPNGLGSIPEEKVQQGNFFIPEGERITDQKQEEVLLIAMVADLLKYEIALREDGHLIFPTQLTRENPELSDPKSDPEGKAVIFGFEGPVLNIYATLVVRLSHSGVFMKKELWKNAATFTSRNRGTYGVFLIDHEAGRGELALSYDSATSEETRLHFEEYIHSYMDRRAITGTVKRERIFACDECKTPVTKLQVAGRRKLGFNWLGCPVCGSRISLLDGDELLNTKLKSKVDEIDEVADAERLQAMKITDLQGKIATNEFDVFLCHNSHDKEVVKQVGEQLKQNGILPWLDVWELPPGKSWQDLLEKQISKIKSAAVFVGPNGIGPWQQMELRAFLSEFVNRGCPVIPVLLSTADEVPEMPIFLRNVTWVDFRKQDPDPLEQLIWGITQERIVHS